VIANLLSQQMWSCPPPPKHKWCSQWCRGGFAVGCALLVVVCVIWSAASVIVKDAEKRGADAFAITYVCNALFALYLPLSLATAPRHDDDDDDKPEEEAPEEEGAATTTSAAAPRCRLPREAASALKLSPLWMVANATYNASLGLTSVTSSTVVSNTSSLWTMAFSIVAGVETRAYLVRKTLGAFLCLAGSGLVAWGDSDDDDDKKLTLRGSLLGDVLALASAALYGAYGTGLRLVLKDAGDSSSSSSSSEPSTTKFFGFMGLWNAALFAVPLALYLHIKYGSSSQIPRAFGASGDTPALFASILLKGLFDNALSDFLWAKAVLLTSPTVATVGLGLTVPLAFGIDAVAGRLDAPAEVVALKGLGAVAVLLGFALVVASGASEAATAYDDDDDAETTPERGRDDDAEAYAARGGRTHRKGGSSNAASLSDASYSRVAAIESDDEEATTTRSGLLPSSSTTPRLPEVFFESAAATTARSPLRGSGGTP